MLNILAQNKCGLVPSKVFLPKGEKRQLVFWTDQDYSQLTTTTLSSTSSTSTEEPVDDFLQVVNGNKPVNIDINNTISDEAPDNNTEDSKPVDPTFVFEEEEANISKDEISSETQSDPSEDKGEEEVIYITTEKVQVEAVATTLEAIVSEVPPTSTASEVDMYATTEPQEITSTTDKLMDATMIEETTKENISLLDQDNELDETTEEGTTMTTYDNLLTVTSILSEENIQVTTSSMSEEITTIVGENITEKENITIEDIADEATTFAEATTHSILVTDSMMTTDKVDITYSTESALAYDDPNSDEVTVQSTVTTMVSSVDDSTTDTILTTTDKLLDVSSMLDNLSGAEDEVQKENSTALNAVVFPDPSMDSEFEITTVKISRPLKQTTDHKITFEDENIDPISIHDIENEIDTEASGSHLSLDFADTEDEYDMEADEDKVQVVTSMSVEQQAPDNESNGEADVNNENVLVVTGSAVPALEEMEVTERDVDVTVTENIIESTTRSDVQDNSFLLSLGLDIQETKEDTEVVEDQTQEPSVETIIISSQDDEEHSNTAAESATTTERVEQIQYDDSGADYYYDDNLLWTSTGNPDVNTRRILDETTTGVPNVEAVYYETTTGSLKSTSTTTTSTSTSTTSTTQSLKTSSSYFPIQAVESDVDFGEVIFDETTTGNPQSNLPVQAVVAEEDDEPAVIFDETTTGSPLKLPLIQPVVFEYEDIANFAAAQNDLDYAENIPETQAVFAETTTGNAGILIKKAEDSDAVTEDNFTPAFTTAPLTTPDSKILSPGDMEDMVAKFAQKMTTLPSVIFDDDIDGDEQTDTELTATTEMDNVVEQVSPTNSAIVDVEAGKVNGPLAIDKVTYYDENIESDEDNYIDDTPIAESSSTFKTVSAAKQSAEEVVDEAVEQTTPAGSTTVINGFIIDKKTIDNNIETVRTGGIAEVDVSDTPIETTELDPEARSKDSIFTTLATEDSRPTEKILEQTTTMTLNLYEVSMNDTDFEDTEDVTDKYLGSASDVVLNEDQENVNGTDYDVFLNGTDFEEIFNTTEEFEYDEASVGNNITTLLETSVENVENNEIETASRKPAPFPVTDLLKGIYKLIQGYIPSQADPDTGVDSANNVPAPTDFETKRLEYFDSPETQPLSSSNNAAPREPLLFVSPKTDNVKDPIDVLNSNTDPFKQLSAPDLSELLVPAEERDDNIQYVFASEVQRSTSRPITLSPFNSSALKVIKEPVLAQDRVDVAPEEEEEGTSFSSFIQKPLTAFLPSFLTSGGQKQKPKVQVAGTLPITVRDQGGQSAGRRPVLKAPPQKTSFPFLGSLFNNVGGGGSNPAPKPARPLRPDVPAQQPIPTFANGNGFVPVTGRQRSSPVSIPLPGVVEVEKDIPESISNDRIGRFSYFKREASAEDTLQDQLIR